MRRRLLIVVVATGVLSAIGLLAIVLLQHAVRRPPPFYVAALEIPAETLSQSSRRFESRIAALFSDASHQSQWQAAFTAEEINGWLSVDLPRRFPQLQSERVSEPRVAIVDGELLIGFHYQGDGFDGPVSVALQLFATESDLLAVRFCKASAGAVPIPIIKVIDATSKLARELDWAIRWTRMEGDPVALAPLRGLVAGESTRRELHAVSLGEDEIVLSGTTISLTAAKPQVVGGSQVFK